MTSNEFTKQYKNIWNIIEQQQEVFNKNISLLQLGMRPDFVGTFARDGIFGRLGILLNCIANINNIYSIDRHDKPTSNDLHNLTINVQGFIANVCGILENMAWLWALLNPKCDVKFERITQISFSNSNFVKTLPEVIQVELKKLYQSTDFFKELRQHRHGLVHKIPPCVTWQYPEQGTTEFDRLWELISKIKHLADNNRNSEAKVLQKELDELHKFEPFYRINANIANNSSKWLSFHLFCQDLRNLQDFVLKFYKTIFDYLQNPPNKWASDLFKASLC
jgi:hypothetical protein